MKLIIFLYLMVLTKTENESDYKTYKLYEIMPRTEQHIQFLLNTEETHENFMFWKYPGIVNNSVDLMVPPDQDEYFMNMMGTNNLEYKLIFQDMHKLLDDERAPINKPFNFHYYQPWPKITEWFQHLRSSHPYRIKILCLGKTYDGRNIQGIRLSYDGIRKPSVFIEGGMHGREKIATATVTYLLSRFLTTTRPDIQSVVEKYDWYFFPVINPDGYVYKFRKNPPWRKTVSWYSENCRGVDPNRNFGYRWSHYGGSTDPCSDLYFGPRPFSEVETRSLARFVKSISHRLFAYISFHSYGKLLTFPYGHTTHHLDNYEDLLAIGRKAVGALGKKRKKRFRIGNVASVLHHMTGTSTDWVKAALKLPIVFTYILDDTKTFTLPPTQIIPVGKNVVESVVALFNEAEKYGYPKSR